MDGNRASDSHVSLGEARPMPGSTAQKQTNQESAEQDRRLNVRFTDGGWDDVEYLASFAGSSKAEAVRRAVRTERFFRKLREQNLRIFVEEKGTDQLRELIFQD